MKVFSKPKCAKKKFHLELSARNCLVQFFVVGGRNFMWGQISMEVLTVGRRNFPWRGSQIFWDIEKRSEIK
jgi:hypothetical protein